MRKRDAVTAICWIILGVIISIWSATFPFGSWKALGPALLPFASGLILILLGSILFFQAMKQNQGKFYGVASLIPHGVAFKRVILTLVGMLLSAVLFELLGFVLTVFCMSLFLLRAIQPQKWDIFYALIFSIGSYLLFLLLLKVPLPQGFVGF